MVSHSTALEGLTFAGFSLLIILVVVGYATAGTPIFLPVFGGLLLAFLMFVIGLYATRAWWEHPE